MKLDIGGIGSIADLLGKVSDKLWPDPLEKAKALERLEQMKQAGEFKLIDAELQMAQMQADINKEEAKHASVFVAGWRPFVGWVCGGAMAYTFAIQPFLTFVLIASGAAFDPAKLPELDGASLATILMGMLGMGGLRTYEKVKGVGVSGKQGMKIR